MKLEHAKKQCFGYDGLGGCAILDYVKSCKGCSFYKTTRQYLDDKEEAEKRYERKMKRDTA